MLTSCSRGLITPFGTLKAGSYWLRQRWWSGVTAAFIFHMGSMETTRSNMQSSLLIQVAWQLKSLVFILSVIYLSPDEAKWPQPAIMAAQTKLDALSCNSRLKLSTASFHANEGCPETPHTHTQQMGRCFPGPDWAKSPVKWKWCGSGGRPCCGESWQGRQWSKTMLMIDFLCCSNHPPVPPAHHWHTRDDNLHVDHLNPVGKRSVSFCPQDYCSQDWSLGGLHLFVQHLAQWILGQ